MFDWGGQRPATSDRHGIVATRDVHLSEQDVGARLQDLQRRVDACQRAEDKVSEMHFSVGGIQDRVEGLALELHTRMSEVQNEVRKTVSEAGSSLKTSKEPYFAQLESSLDLVRQEFAETRQSLDLKLQSISKEISDLKAQRAVDLASKPGKDANQADPPEEHKEINHLKSQRAAVSRSEPSKDASQAVPLEESRVAQWEVRLNNFESVLANLIQECRAQTSLFVRYVGDSELQTKTASNGTKAADEQNGENQAVQAQGADEQDPAAADQDCEELSRITSQGAQSFEFTVAESCWSLVFVLGHVKATWLDESISVSLLISSMIMQVVFSIIVSLPAFLGAPFHDQKSYAEVWRRTVAHDNKYLDLAGSSLATRVCWGDGSLIVSLSQSELLDHINGYLFYSSPDPTDEDYLSPPSLSPGIVLCLLSIFLWCLAIITELRDAISCCEAVLCLPKFKHTKIDNGQLIGITQLRALVIYSCSFVRSGFAVWILIAGVIWLARTVSIQDLILNAVALVAVLEIDEMVFTAMMPKHLQTVIQHMEAIPVVYSRGYKHVQSLAIFLCMPAAIIFSYYYFLQELSSDMITVKASLCAGNIEFVFAENGNTQAMYALRTIPYVGDERGLTLAEEAVTLLADYSGSHWRELSNLGYTTMVWDAGSLKLRTTETMEAFVTQKQYTTVFSCRDYDAMPEVDRSYLQDKWAILQRLTGVATDKCSDFREFCSERFPGLVRFLCPRTCRCENPYKGFSLRTTTHGCPAGCTPQREAAIEVASCRDMPPDQDWSNMITEFFNATTRNWKEENKKEIRVWFDMAKIMGCELLEYSPISPFSSINLCKGGPDIASFAARCPVACQCTMGLDLNYACPNSCILNTTFTPCLDLGLPDEPDGSSADCSEAKAKGLCERDPARAQLYCRATCGFCCADVGLQQGTLFIMTLPGVITNCAEVYRPPDDRYRDGDLCESLSDGAATYCRASCKLCTNTTPFRD